MSDLNQIKNKIKEELQQSKPYDVKVLRNLMNTLWDLRRRQEYQYISDSEYLDILKEIYEASPKFFLKSLYPKISAWGFPSFLGIKNEIIKHIIENVNLGSGDHILSDIKKEFEKSPSMISKENILSYLFDEQLYQFDEQFYDIVGETFKLNPELYMKKLYDDVRNKIIKLYGMEKLNEMEKYIIEKYCLYDGEQLLDIFYGNVRQSKNLILSLGRIYVTNIRIIGQGVLIIMPSARVGLIGATISLFEKPIGSKKNKLLTSSIQQEIPCYGYNFPYKNLFNLKKKKNLEYRLKRENKTIVIKIILPKSVENRAEHLDILFDILTKEQT